MRTMGKICDTEMCDRMREAREKFFETEPNPDPAKGFLRVLVCKKSGKPVLMHLKYCPFCGTRISPGVVGCLT